MIPVIDHSEEVELRSLRALVTVADLGTFRGAADSLGYTQSAISHQIAGLERALQTAIFVRPGGRAAVSLTPAGEIAYRRARRILGEVTSLAADVLAAEHGASAPLRIGTFQTATTELLPRALRTLRDERPDIEVVLDEVVDNAGAFAALAHGDLDLAFLVNPAPDERVIAIPLLADPWVILTRRDSELTVVEQPSFQMLDGTDVVAWTRRWPSQLELEAAWRRRAIAPRVVYRTDDNLALQRLVASGFGHACVDRLTAAGAVEPALTWVEPRELLAPRQIALCHPRNRSLDTPALTLIDAVRRQFGA